MNEMLEQLVTMSTTLGEPERREDQGPTPRGGREGGRVGSSRRGFPAGGRADSVRGGREAGGRVPPFRWRRGGLVGRLRSRAGRP